MLGALCSPCCAGQCPQLPLTADQFSSISFEFDNSGTAERPGVFLSMRPVTSGTYLPGGGAVLPAYTFTVTDGSGGSYEIKAQLGQYLDNFWTLTIQFYRAGFFNRAFSFEFGCVSGTTIAYGFSPETISELSNFNPGAGSVGCCCQQFGSYVIFPSASLRQVCGQNIYTPTQPCDIALDADGVLSGICRRVAQPFDSIWEDSLTSAAYGDVTTIRLSFSDWRMYRANPLP